MCGRSAHIKIANRGSVLRPARCRPEKEKLFECEFPLKDVSLAESESAFDVERRKNLTVENKVSKVGSVLCNGIDHRVAEFLTLLIPCPLLEVIWSVLHETGQDVFAGRRYGGVR